jgi:hypothetical protein
MESWMKPLASKSIPADRPNRTDRKPSRVPWSSQLAAYYLLTFSKRLQINQTEEA